MTSEISSSIIEAINSKVEIENIGENHVVYSNLRGENIETLVKANLLTEDVPDELPPVEAFLRFLNEYPVFRARIECISTDTQRVAYVVGIYTNLKNSTSTSLDKDTRTKIKSELIEQFYTADTVTFEGPNLSVMYTIAPSSVA